MADGTSRFSAKGKDIHHYKGVSSLSEYTVVSASAVAVIQKDIPLENLSLFARCIPSGYGAVNNVAKVPAGATVAVYGCGGVGLSVIKAAKEANAIKIFAIDVNPTKLEKAKSLGATDTINPNDHPDESVDEIINKQLMLGVDFAFVACNGGTQVINTAFESTILGWGFSLILSEPSTDSVLATIPFNFVKGKSITSCANGNVKPSEISSLVEKFASGSISLDGLVESSTALDQVSALHDNNAVRTIVSFS
ncbi:hypothetical protein BB560_001151 [Smittium megazygosporum]|uniref:Alcohol dehydrogenase-like C-terminal domain-containing protein n=1 Tax=Smittium megazygosporum TaxID=133381 RepID=A0A2T9ZIE2_9FUNG|nr:hypothetical protein BB560_001151 [Smittium megazygosporum]